VCLLPNAALVEQLPSTPRYECRVRDNAGRFLKDPLADYRRGSLPAQMKDHIGGLKP
jgi:hypothetical protein